MKIILYDNIEGKQLKNLFGFCFERCDNIYLTNYYTDLITKKEKEKADEELIKKYVLEDMERRKAFYIDEEYRKSILDLYGTEQKAILYFNALVVQDLFSLGENRFFYMCNREIEECNIDKGICKKYILEDIKRRERLKEDEYFRKDLLKKYKTLEDVIIFFNTRIEVELGIVLVEDISTVESLGIMMNEEDDKESFEKRYASRDVIKQRLNTFIQKFILTERNVTNYSRMTESSATFVEYRFEINDGMKTVLSNLDKIYDKPVLVGEIDLEDPVLCYGDKEILAICSHESYAILDLSEEEYKEFLKLNILHELEK